MFCKKVSYKPVPHLSASDLIRIYRSNGEHFATARQFVEVVLKSIEIDNIPTVNDVNKLTRDFKNLLIEYNSVKDDVNDAIAELENLLNNIGESSIVKEVLYDDLTSISDGSSATLPLMGTLQGYDQYFLKFSDSGNIHANGILTGFYSSNNYAGSGVLFSGFVYGSGGYVYSLDLSVNDSGVAYLIKVVCDPYGNKTTTSTSIQIEQIYGVRFS